MRTEIHCGQVVVETFEFEKRFDDTHRPTVNMASRLETTCGYLHEVMAEKPESPKSKGFRVF